MREINYQTQGTCSRLIRILLDDNDVIDSVQFMGGCPGNTHGLAAMLKGQRAADVVERLRGIDCGGKGTSCPDQLSRALAKALQSAV